MRFSRMRRNEGNTMTRYGTLDRDTPVLLEYEETHGKMQQRHTRRPLGEPQRPLRPTMRKAAQLQGHIAIRILLVAASHVVARPPQGRTAPRLGATTRPGRTCDQIRAVDQFPRPLPRVGRRLLPHVRVRLPTRSPVSPEQPPKSRRHRRPLEIAPDELGILRALPA